MRQVSTCDLWFIRRSGVQCDATARFIRLTWINRSHASRGGSRAGPYRGVLVTDLVTTPEPDRHRRAPTGRQERGPLVRSSRRQQTLMVPIVTFPQRHAHQGPHVTKGHPSSQGAPSLAELHRPSPFVRRYFPGWCRPSPGPPGYPPVGSHRDSGSCRCTHSS